MTTKMALTALAWAAFCLWPWSAAQSEPLDSPVAPEVVADAELASSPSRATVELRFDIADLERALNARAPKKFGGRIGDPTDALFDDHIEWTLTLGEIALRGADSALTLDVPFTGSASLKGRFGVKRLSKGISETADVGGILRGRMVPMWGGDWTIDPQLSANVELSKAEAELFGRAIKVSFRGAVEDEVNAKVRAFIAEVNRHTAADGTIRRELDKGWAALHRVVRVRDAPPVFVVVRPHGVSADEPLITGHELVLRVAASVHSALRIGGEQPILGDPEPLPALSPVPEDGNGFSLVVPVVVQLNSLQALTPEHLGLPDFFDTPVGTVRLGRISLQGDGGNLDVKADIGIGSTEDTPIEGEVHLVGEPVLDQERGLLRVKELRFDMESSSVLLVGASKLLEPVLLAELSERLVFDLREFDDELAAAGNSALAAMDGELRTGAHLDATISDARLSSVVVKDGWLVVVAEAAGDASVRIKSIVP